MNSVLRLSLIAILFAFGAVPIGAHDGATGPTKVRMDAMSEMGKALKSLTLAARAGDLATAPEAAAQIELLKLKGTQLPALFEARDIPHISESLPSVWDDPDGFKARIVEYTDAIGLLNASYMAEDATEAATALRAVTQSCNSCHQGYRE